MLHKQQRWQVVQSLRNTHLLRMERVLVGQSDQKKGRDIVINEY